ncbi:MAG: PepSY domain-containing protein [Candidatus Eremiobacterota bacterium]
MVRKLHWVLGLVCALPLFGWASSGFLSALPRASTTGVTYERLDLDRLKVGPLEAAERARVLDPELRFSSMTLQQADGRLFWQLVAGGRSLRVDAETGQAAWARRGRLADYFAEAHFFFFAGPLQRPLLLGFTLALLGVLATGLALARRKLRAGRDRPRRTAKAAPP